MLSQTQQQFSLDQPLQEKFVPLAYFLLCLATLVTLVMTPLPDDRRVASPALLKVGVVYAPRPAKPTDYQTRRDEHFLQDLRPTLEKIYQAPVAYVELAADKQAEALANGDVALVLVPVAKSREGVALAPVVSLAPLMRSDTSIRTWEDFRGRTICFSEENETARALVHTLGAQPMPASSPAKSLAAMRQGDCDAALHDERLVRGLIHAHDKRWDKFNATLSPRETRQLTLIPASHDPDDWRLAQRVAREWSAPVWDRLIAQWVADVDFEVYLEQDAPDCH